MSEEIELEDLTISRKNTGMRIYIPQEETEKHKLKDAEKVDIKITDVK